MAEASYRDQAREQMRVSTAPAPKEIGILQRIEGVNGGVSEIRMRLESFGARLRGEPEMSPNAQATTRAAGLTSAITDTENEIRACIGLLTQLSDAF